MLATWLSIAYQSFALAVAVLCAAVVYCVAASSIAGMRARAAYARTARAQKFPM
jgi:hypothetical protein